ncbi:MAG TPA: transporter substrate-binding domain-containing protein [Steroidobacteraceae bacterium]|nr:transporter substrate-binding domain-containing protein [Steroidobacteraceae bacterium]
MPQPGPVWQAAPAASFTTEEAAVAGLLQAEDARLALMPAVAAVKWQTHAPIFDPPRETAVIHRAGDLGEQMGLAADPVRALFELQAQLARRVQSTLHRQWAHHGFSFAGPVTSLAQLRPRLDELTIQLLQGLYLAAPALERRGFAAQYAALARLQLRDSHWSEAGRSQLLRAMARITRVRTPPEPRIRASGILRVGTTGDYAPFSIETGGALSGSDITLAQELAGSLNARVAFVRTSWSSLLEDLTRGKFDLAIGGVSVTPAREARAAFSLGYSSGGKTILARCADSGKYTSLAAVDQPRVRVIVNSGGTNEAYARANIHRARLLVYQDNRAVFDSIAAGGADVMITDDVEAELQSRRHRGLCRAYAGTLTHSEKAILMPRDPELIALVNRWLQGELAAGEPDRLLKSYLDRESRAE